MDIKNLNLQRLKDMLYLQLDATSDPRYQDFKKMVLAEREGIIEELRTEIELRRSKKVVKPRWPEDTPEDVLEACKKYWSRTTEADYFRIHCWSENFVWTGYPNGGYSNNGGWNATPAAFYMIRRDGSATSFSREIRLQGRVSQKQMQTHLEEAEKNLKNNLH